jgi:hypothetical protein
VDPIIIGLLTGELLRVGTLDQILKALPETPKGAEEIREREIAKLDHRRDRLVELYEWGKINRKRFSEREREIEKDRAALALVYPRPSRRSP